MPAGGRADSTVDGVDNGVWESPTMRSLMAHNAEMPACIHVREEFSFSAGDYEIEHHMEFFSPVRMERVRVRPPDLELVPPRGSCSGEMSAPGYTHANVRVGDGIQVADGTT